MQCNAWDGNPQYKHPYYANLRCYLEYYNNASGKWDVKSHVSFCFIQAIVERDNYYHIKIHKIYIVFQPVSKVNVEGTHNLL